MFPSRQLQLHHPSAARVKDLMLLGKVHQRRRAAIALVIRKLLTVLEHPGVSRQLSRECLSLVEWIWGFDRQKKSEQEWSSQKTIVHHIVQLVLVHHVANESQYNTNGVLRVQCGLILLSHYWLMEGFVSGPVCARCQVFPLTRLDWFFWNSEARKQLEMIEQLVGGPGPPLWKIWKSIGMMSNPIYGKIKNGNQTTNQTNRIHFQDIRLMMLFRKDFLVAQLFYLS